MDKDKDKQSIRADEYEEKVQYAPGWPPQQQPEASVDPQLMTDLSEIKEHPPTQQECMPQIVEQLKQCYDPEISVDIYNLGLIYDVKVTEEGWVHVLMSLTSAFCPAADLIPRDVQQKIESIPNLKCKVKITMQPQWGRDMINPEVRELMGL
jgi:metal-sulfur cluster biosynthetic enzyme